MIHQLRAEIVYVLGQNCNGSKLLLVKMHYLPVDGILQTSKLSSLGMLDTEPDYFPTQT